MRHRILVSLVLAFGAVSAAPAQACIIPYEPVNKSWRIEPASLEPGEIVLRAEFVRIVEQTPQRGDRQMMIDCGMDLLAEFRVVEVLDGAFTGKTMTAVTDGSGVNIKGEFILVGRFAPYQGQASANMYPPGDLPSDPGKPQHQSLFYMRKPPPGLADNRGWEGR